MIYSGIQIMQQSLLFRPSLCILLVKKIQRNNFNYVNFK